ncbi:FAD-dependent oxidoreductase [Flavobacterium rivuli WB 3.3-2 = DSM 21788]|uniref:FAD-dependent oxidoreductase n=1 Tax=Flavobacterium rivuli WB 3.3-2 = DSM 21788 TaxID=1121895 RepID=A0A0A2LXR2_9FLAO|nr:FAD-dependent oxidoreductase [Flavobacterium rivuli]KGO84779.1 FAD-dependent oxidoreductase [Flavobacterium rivuli WB 3.3-2 = DSM 21788]
MKDFIIVGAGLAGICFAETAFINNKSFTVISDASHNSSHVAAGIYNPVILKRFSLPQDSKVHLDYMKPFYKAIEEQLNIKFDFEIPVYRKFASVEEQNNWFEAADKPALEPFLSTQIVHKKYENLPSPFGFGQVLHTGYVDTEVLIKAYQAYLNENDNLLNDTFNYSDLIIHEDHIEYKDINAKHIVFAEGFGLHANPYFNYLPLDGTKGELLVIKAPQLQLDVAINAGVFILPMGNDVYKVGATYEWYDKNATPTEAGKAELIEKLNEVITCDYEIVEHLAGIRPTTKDRKSLIGTHHLHKNVHLLNGLGTRGVMLGPAMAKLLYDCIENGTPISREINLSRFMV